ncbi:carbon-nitrogen hydrolase family protein [Thalassococcus lentus]|uniref:Carbon-nitrogen hydrolase family protein n=1 Tax=Thalassococcus lentus TaxID=1210524 RepID=A0ABT4XNB2_9RHOB|nr:carbon-nitrogen hydrolase family protein [Thalassococcus lentus]MDA7423441.1 carbon-nitrogen hydrolase family protein [Thalassococcus lentus]
MRAAILQLTSSDDPEQNTEHVQSLLVEAAGKGAECVFTPEVSNCVSMDRAHQNAVLVQQEQDGFLHMVREQSKALNLWILTGSVALRAEPPEDRFVNRSFLTAPDGGIAGQYDKIHMFDVQVSVEETYLESSGYAPGSRAVACETPFGKIGMTICYDLRFSYLYRALAHAGCSILAVPSAFSPGTGPAHWQPLLQARAIETGCFVIAPAQTGTHSASKGRQRKTYGHSMVINPWGEVVLDAGTEPGIHMVDLDLAQVADARRRIPALTHDRAFEGP